MKILKEIFIPLPPRDSEAAREIEHGKLFRSPVLGKLPFPIQQIVSNIFRQQLRKEEATPLDGKCKYLFSKNEAPV